jgi:di/tripeptidase
MQVDLRSESAEHLAKLTRQMNEAIEAAVREERGRWQADEKQLWVEIKQVGKRPAGTQPDTAPIVQLAMAADKELGIESRTGASSTDSNLPISLGIPAVTLPGGGMGRRAHALDEMFNTKDSHLGTQRALLVTLGLVGLAQ